MPGFWRKCRIAFRCVRFTVWAVVLLVLAAFGWFNYVGLPGFLKTRLVAALHERGADLDFSRLRLRLTRGVVCANVRIGGLQHSGVPVLTLREVQLRVNFPALLHRRLQVDSLVLHDGNFTLPLSPTNSLALTNLQTELQFAADDTWTLDHFRAGLAGVNLSLGGQIAHASEVRSWKIFAGQTTGDHGGLQAALVNFSKALAQFHFQDRPQLNARLDGDARDVHSFTLNVNARVPGVQTPWFAAQNLQIAARLSAPADAPTNDEPAWGFWTNLQPFRLDWTARGADLRSENLVAETVECDGVWHAPNLAITQLSARFSGVSLSLSGELTNAPEVRNWKFFAGQKAGDGGSLPSSFKKISETLAQIHFQGRSGLRARLAGDARDIHSVTLNLDARAHSLHTPWFVVQDGQLAAHLAMPADAPATGDPSWGFWLNLQPFRLDWTASGADLQSDKLRASAVECEGVWHAPELAVSRLSARLGGGQLAAAAKLDVATRELVFTNNSSFDLHAVAALLTEQTRKRLAEISWPQPPQLRASGALVLPAWTNGASDWRADVEPSVRLHGELAFTNARVDDLVTLDSVRTHFNYANLIWNLPDLELTRGRTELALSGEESEATKNFRCRVAGRIDPEMARPFLTTSNAVRGFELVTLHEQLALVLDAGGNLRDFATFTANGRVAVTNFAVRSQTFESVAADLSYSNQVLDFLHPQMFRAHGTQTMTADAVALDFNARMIFFTNGFSTTEPMAVCRAIGPKTARIIEPYEFLAPPTARAHGQLPLRDINNGRDLAGTDLSFDIIQCVPFRWTKLQTTNITGTIHWLGQELVLTNLVASFYGGMAGGHAYFDFRPVGYDCDFNFGFALTNADVRLFAVDFPSVNTNQLAGILSGQAVVTGGNSKTWRSWNGFGDAHLRDGLLWNIPIFGFVSPLLNTLTPGLDVGNSRATDATARFVMTNGVIFTDSLDIRSLTMRVQYVGTVDLQQHVNARATAQLLRNTPLFGSVVSLVLWPVSKVFECDLTGTLADPKITPVYLPFPKLLAVPLHPLRSLEQIFSPPSTNAPAAK